MTNEDLLELVKKLINIREDIKKILGDVALNQVKEGSTYLIRGKFRSLVPTEGMTNTIDSLLDPGKVLIANDHLIPYVENIIHDYIAELTYIFMDITPVKISRLFNLNIQLSLLPNSYDASPDGRKSYYNDAMNNFYQQSIQLINLAGQIIQSFSVRQMGLNHLVERFQHIIRPRRRPFRIPSSPPA